MGGVPPVKEVWGAAPGGRRRFFGDFLTDFHEVLLLFWDQLRPKNGYKYPATTAASRELYCVAEPRERAFRSTIQLIQLNVAE